MKNTAETDYPIVEVRLPLTPDALVSAESQVDVFVDQLDTGRDEALAFALRLVVSEGFRNALTLQPLQGRLKVIRLSLRGCPGGVWISLTAPGRGFPFRDAFPPYPERLIGQELRHASTLNENLIVRVVGPTRVLFRVQARPAAADEAGRVETVPPADPHTLALLALCRECEEVNITFDPVEGNSLNALYALHPEEHRAAAG